MPIPEFVARLRAAVGTEQLWLPGVTAVVRRGSGADTEILCVQRSDNHRWTPITGIVDPGEEPAIAAAREALEEACVAVDVDRLAAVSVTDPVTYPNGDRAVYLDLTFACTWRSGEAAVGDDESVAVAWYPNDALPPMRSEMLARVEAALSEETQARFVT